MPVPGDLRGAAGTSWVSSGARPESDDKKFGSSHLARGNLAPQSPPGRYVSWQMPRLVGPEGELHALPKHRAPARSGCPTRAEVAARAGFGRPGSSGRLDGRPDAAVVQAACYEDDVQPYALIGRLERGLLPATGRSPMPSPRQARERRPRRRDRSPIAEDLASARRGSRPAGPAGAAGRLGLVVLEDVHWADAMSVDVLLPLAARLAETARSPGAAGSP